MGEFNAKDANFLWRQIGRIDGVIETLNRTEGEMPEIIAGVLKRIRDDIDKFVDNNMLTDVCRIPILQQRKRLYRKVRSIYSMTCIQQKPTNYIIMSWINSDGRGVIRNISQKQNYARC